MTRPELGDLPILPVLEPFAAALHEHRTAILVAPPGAGKTTAAPLWLASEPWLAGQRIVVLEPRRLATRAAAQRMASLLGERVGDTVGYQTRDERHIGPGTRIEVVTEGVLTRRLQHDPSLDGVGVVMFDEIHERNLPTDLGLAFLLDARASLRPDLAIVAMSATPHIDAVRRVLPDAPLIESDGRIHPVEQHWLPMGKNDRLEQAMAAAIGKALREQHGDLLVFLPGIGEIRRVERALDGRLPADVDVYLLAGALSLAEHDAALAPSPAGRRRVVLSTDIAESSLTVPGVRVVVDAGLARVPRFDVRTGMSRLTTVTSSRASAEQRAGRAGRTEPGACYRLWSKIEHATRRAHLDAEITQIDLAGVALELAMWGTPATQLSFMDQPPQKALQYGNELLVRLGAVDADLRPTDLGRAMNQLPLHPRLARMVVAAAEMGHGRLACILAALLDDRDVFRGSYDQLPTDIGLRVAVVTGEHGHDLADRRDVRRVRDRADDLARRARIATDTVAMHATGLVLGLAYPDRLAVRRSQPGQFQLRGGSTAMMPPTDTLAREAFIIAADLDGNRTNGKVRMAAAIDATDVARVFADEVEYRESLVWHKQRGDLIMHSEVRLGSIVLDERKDPAQPGPETVEALLERVRATRFGALSMTDEVEQLRARVAFLRSHRGEEWPDWSDATLLATLDQWLAPYLVQATSLADLQRVDIGMALSASLSWDAGSHLNDLAPTHLVTPKGRPALIDYSRDNPTASVRVQFLFGVKRHPTILGGEVPLTLELMSPAERPIQITADLPGFWTGSWAMVRKEMAGRYPKHNWPADPTRP